MSKRIPSPVDNSRRGFLRRLCVGAGGVAGSAALAGCEVAEIRQSGEILTSYDFDIADHADLGSVGGMVSIDAGVQPLLLIRVADAEFAALARICTHQACEMLPGSIGKWDKDKKQLTCLCHNSVFDQTGKYLTGPGGVANLGSFPVTFDATTGKGTIDLGGAA